MDGNPLNPLEELASLDSQIDRAGDLEALKPIFYRLDELMRQHAGDFDLQLAAADVKQHLVRRGSDMKSRLSDTAVTATIQPQVPPVPEPPIFVQAPPPPPLPTATIPVPPILLPPESSDSIRPLPATSPSIPIAAAPIAVPNLPEAPQAPPPIPALPAQPPSRSPINWKLALLVGAVIGFVVAAPLIVVRVIKKRNPPPPAVGTNIAVSIATTPSGASIRINGEEKCTSDCKLDLAPGNYEITAFLNGYEPSGRGIEVKAGEPANISLGLEPQSQSVRILTDFDSGKVTLDAQPPVDLQESQFLFEKVPAGNHTVKVTGKNSETSFPFALANGTLPAISGPLAAKNVAAVVVTSFANQAHMVTSSGPLKLVANGQPEGDTSPNGIDLKNFQSGANELTIGEGKDARNLKDTYGPAPMVTVYLKSDSNTGTLVVSTQEDDVHVFVNGKEQKKLTQRGQLRIQFAPGPVAVRVAKEGFETMPLQLGEVKKGGDTRLEFKMKVQPKLSSLQVQGAAPGTEVLLDQTSLGTVGADGTLHNATIAPGNHTVTLRRPQFTPKQVARTFPANQTVVISGADVTLVAERTSAPPPPKSEPKAEPPPAPKAVAVKPQPKSFGMDAFDNSSTVWHDENGVFRHKGEGFFPVKERVSGIFTFNVYMIKGGGLLRGGKLRWAVNYTDAKNYALFELDSDNLSVRDVVNGKNTEKSKVKHNVESKEKVWPIQIDVTKDSLVTKIEKDQKWITLSTWTQPGCDFTTGKFGFLVQGSDEIGISDFKFTQNPE